MGGFCGRFVCLFLVLGTVQANADFKPKILPILPACAAELTNGIVAFNDEIFVERNGTVRARFDGHIVSQINFLKQGITFKSKTRPYPVISPRGTKILVSTTDDMSFLAQHAYHVFDLSTGEKLPGAVETYYNVSWATDDAIAVGHGEGVVVIDVHSDKIVLNTMPTVENYWSRIVKSIRMKAGAHPHSLGLSLPSEISNSNDNDSGKTKGQTFSVGSEKYLLRSVSPEKIEIVNLENHPREPLELIEFDSKILNLYVMEAVKGVFAVSPRGSNKLYALYVIQGGEFRHGNSGPLLYMTLRHVLVEIDPIKKIAIQLANFSSPSAKVWTENSFKHNMYGTVSPTSQEMYSNETFIYRWLELSADQKSLVIHQSQRDDGRTNAVYHPFGLVELDSIYVPIDAGLSL